MNIKAELDAIIAKYDLLSHPFYQAWNAGTLPREALAFYAREWGSFVKTVPAAWAAHGDTAIAAEETTHIDLWEQFAMGLGESIQEPETDAVKELVAGMQFSTQHPAASMGALYAFEAQQPGTSGSKLKGLREHYPVQESAQEYFVVHEVDFAEPALLIKRIEALPANEQAIAKEACEGIAERLWNGLTDIHNRFCTTPMNA